ncbi:MAG: hypothetical protein QOG68_1539, partial [Solirubrobacteraceae bacterium]|nr:hypothetical protein [Solirubrobacteraceae bacterium]
ANAQARIFSVPGKGDSKTRYFGCRLGRKPVFLTDDIAPKAADETHRANDTFRLGGTWAGWHSVSRSDFGAGEYGAQIEVRSLAGARRSITVDASRYGIKALKILADGTVAWVLRSGGLREVDAIERTATQPTPIAVEIGIDSASLALTSTTVSWTQAGVHRSAAITPPTAGPVGNAIGPQGLDGRFGDCGTLVPASPKPNVFTEASQLARGPQNTIVAAGTATSGKGDPLEQDTYVVSRFTAAGKFDASFGGSGVVQTRVPRPAGAQNVQLTGMVVQPDGKVVVAGYIRLADPVDAEAILARYNADGTLDASFGTGGIVRDAVPAQTSADIEALARHADGTLLVAGQRDSRFYVARLTPDGALDATFGSGGIAADAGTSTSSIDALLVMPDGSIAAAGGAGAGRPLLVRLSAAGALQARATPAPGASAVFRALALTAAGEIVAAGTATNIVSTGQVVLARFTAAGATDKTFGDGGTLLDPQITDAHDLAIDAAGRLLVTASFALTPGNYGGSGLIRYSPAGARDARFGFRGTLGGISSYGLTNSDVLLGDDGTALVAQDNGGAYAVSRFALEEPATTATAAASSVCAMATALKLKPVVRTQRIDVSLRLRAPGTLALTATITVGHQTLAAGHATVLRPYIEGAIASIPISKAAAKLLGTAKSAKLTVTAGRPGGAKTTYRAVLAT